MWAQLALPCVDTKTPTRPAPIVKWVGGKTRILSQLLPLLPPGVEFMRHFEPFMGGASMFFARRPSRAVLSDKNADLCMTHKVVRDAVDEVIDWLRKLAEQHHCERYYELRERYNRCSLSDVERAALFIYLNKTCFNGLHRVNRKGAFNVPVGRYVAPRILDEAQLRAASRELRRAELKCEAFEVALARAGRGDFVYLDPPYVPVSRTSNFTAYSAEGFTWNDQLRLRDVFAELDRVGCKVMLSNSASEAVRELYSGYVIERVAARRSISCDARTRGAVEELVVRNYGAPIRRTTHVHPRGVNAAQLDCLAFA